MYLHITKLVNLLPLPEDTLFYILYLAGYVQLRNGKYIPQINKNFYIFKLLKQVPPFQNGHVQLFIKTEWFRRSFCDKIITLRNRIYFENEEQPYHHNGEDQYQNQDITNVLVRFYDSSWYEYDECNGQHHIKYEEHECIK